MKYLIIILIVLTACSDTDQKVHISALEKNANSEIVTADGIPYSGEVFDTFPSGALRMTGNFKDGKEDGSFVWKNEAGDKVVSNEYTAGEVTEEKVYPVKEEDKNWSYKLGSSGSNKYDDKVIKRFMSLMLSQNYDKVDAYLDLLSTYNSKETVTRTFKLYDHFYGRVQSFEVIDYKEQHVEDIIQLGARVEVKFKNFVGVINLNLLEIVQDSFQLFSYSLEPNSTKAAFYPTAQNQFDEYVATNNLKGMLSYLPKAYQTLSEAQFASLDSILQSSENYQYKGHHLLNDDNGIIVQLYYEGEITDKLLKNSHIKTSLICVYEIDEKFEKSFVGFNLKAITKDLAL